MCILCGRPICLVGEFTVRVAAEERGTNLRQELLGDQLQARLQGVGDLQNGATLIVTPVALHRTRSVPRPDSG